MERTSIRRLIICFQRAVWFNEYKYIQRMKKVDR